MVAYRKCVAFLPGFIEFCPPPRVIVFSENLITRTSSCGKPQEEYCPQHNLSWLEGRVGMGYPCLGLGWGRRYSCPGQRDGVGWRGTVVLAMNVMHQCWNEHGGTQKTQKNSILHFRWRGPLVTIFHQLSCQSSWMAAIIGNYKNGNYNS